LSFEVTENRILRIYIEEENIPTVTGFYSHLDDIYVAQAKEFL